MAPPSESVTMMHTISRVTDWVERWSKASFKTPYKKPMAIVRWYTHHRILFSRKAKSRIPWIIVKRAPFILDP
jgi:hypothetical protein